MGINVNENWITIMQVEQVHAIYVEGFKQLAPSHAWEMMKI